MLPPDGFIYFGKKSYRLPRLTPSFGCVRGRNGPYFQPSVRSLSCILSPSQSRTHHPSSSLPFSFSFLDVNIKSTLRLRDSSRHVSFREGPPAVNMLFTAPSLGALRRRSTSSNGAWTSFLLHSFFECPFFPALRSEILIPVFSSFLVSRPSSRCDPGSLANKNFFPERVSSFLSLWYPIYCLRPPQGSGHPAPLSVGRTLLRNPFVSRFASF